LLVVVCDFYPLSVPIVPNETDSPLVVDANAVLTLAVPFQLFELKAGPLKIQERCGRRQLEEATDGNRFDRGESSDPVPFEYRLGVAIVEAPNHLFIV